MHFLEVDTFDDAVAFVLERKQLAREDLHGLAMMFGDEALAKLRELIRERGIEMVGDKAE